MCVQHWYLYDLKLKRSWVVKSPCHLWLCVHSIHVTIFARAMTSRSPDAHYLCTHTLRHRHFSSDNHKRTFSLSICYLLRPFKPGMTQPRFDDKQVLEMYAKCVCGCVLDLIVVVAAVVCCARRCACVMHTCCPVQIRAAQKPRRMILSCAIWISMKRDCCCYRCRCDCCCYCVQDEWELKWFTNGMQNVMWKTVISLYGDRCERQTEFEFDY